MDKIIFLDRDGVINKDLNGYVTAWPEFEFLPNVLEAIKRLSELGFKVVVVSNQAGVAKGYYTAETLARITAQMLETVRAAGGRIFSVHYCTHRDEDDCICRKPKTGLFKQALAGISVNLKETFFVGDNERDIEAGKKMGCRTILVLSGITKTKADVYNFKHRPDFIADDLWDAVERIIAKGKGSNDGKEKTGFNISA
ncbi:MAG: D-glycero-beta-D-manno-heptose 1,7-bisphosphate 7-phosphatase [Candidatus Omnitrophica bacterium]|nr:D-glycero-beta-D-manno-heptose 1,7-bisphosphate 7-phosphatase [Candidatus Omnitrophota bacterium]MCG2704108.1 D-glycero-beta-D-manno-heptose 1,7-bisphosphate 7-phosphatase [Candidatus Omnitrophota bacterium]